MNDYDDIFNAFELLLCSLNHDTEPYSMLIYGELR